MQHEQYKCPITAFAYGVDTQRIGLENQDILRITLSTGETIDIEVFERVPGQIQIRSQDGQIVITMSAANSFSLSSTRK